MRPIPLSRGRGHALVDDHNYDRLAAFAWTLHPEGYAFRSATVGGRAVTIYMHREVLGATRGETVDHANRNGLDNRRRNLRRCTTTQNLANTGPHAGRRFRGVYWIPNCRKWRAEIQCHGKRERLGLFASDVDAAIAYNRRAIELFGDFAYQNPIGDRAVAAT